MIEIGINLSLRMVLHVKATTSEGCQNVDNVKTGKPEVGFCLWRLLHKVVGI